jgi:uncharacterized protein YfbU (UPF0304 family)
MSLKTERFEMRFDQLTLERIDGWRSSQGDLPSRAEAIRRLVDTALIENSIDKSVRFSDGEHLILMMLCELQKGLKVHGELDPKFIKEAIHGGHYWALNWTYTGLFHGYRDSNKAVSEVVDILDMWSFLEEGYEALSTEDKKTIEEKTEGIYKNVRFVGFDGNNETEHLGIARFLVEEMERFESFKGRDFNSHSPSLNRYHKMLSVFSKTRHTLIGRGLSVNQIVEILNAQKL